MNEHTDESLSHYYNMMKDVDTLPSDVVRDLIRKAQAGDITARNMVMKHNLRLVLAMAYRDSKKNHTTAMEDRIQYGNIGLVRAIEKYDPDKINPDTGNPYAFSTYATWWIKQSIDRECMNSANTIRIPIHVLKSYGAFVKIKNRLIEKGNHNPKEEDFIPYLDSEPMLKLDMVQNYIHKMPQVRSDILTSPVDGVENSVYDYTIDEHSDVAESFENADLKEYIQEKVHQLPERLRRVIEMRFGLNGEDIHTLEEAGDRLGITRERVRQIQVEGLKSLRHTMRHENQNLETLV